MTGTLPDGTAFTGALSNLTTSVVGGVLTLTGTITGTGLPAGGTTFTAPIQDLVTPNGCTILTLDLGPLHLDLLGLVIDLAPINLDITAVPGAGNLLGNLLCAVAGLLDGPREPAGRHRRPAQPPADRSRPLTPRPHQGKVGSRPGERDPTDGVPRPQAKGPA